MRFEVRELAAILGTTPRRVEGWVERGLLRPTARGRGPGRRRRFDLAGVLLGALLMRFQELLGDRSARLKPLMKAARLGRYLKAAASFVTGETVESLIRAPRTFLRSTRVVAILRQTSPGGLDLRVLTQEPTERQLDLGQTPEPLKVRERLDEGDILVAIDLTPTLRAVATRLREEAV